MPVADHNERIIVTLHKNVVEEIEELAAQSGWTKSQVVQYLIVEKLDQFHSERRKKSVIFDPGWQEEMVFEE